MGRDTVATRCFSWMREASFCSTSRRQGSIFWIFLRTAIALAAKPSRAYSSARGARTATASRSLPARTSTSASCIFARGSALPLLRTSMAFA